MPPLQSKTKNSFLKKEVFEILEPRPGLLTAGKDGQLENKLEEMKSEGARLPLE